MLCLFVVFKNTDRRRVTQTNTKLNRFIERVNYLMRLSPQSSQIWGHLPSSGITSNIYKPLRRINQEGTGWALRPITSAKPSGFVTVDLMDLCDAEGFQSCCFGTRPLLKPFPPQRSREGQTPGADLWQHFSQTLRCYSGPLLRLQPPHFF